jgi:hypothetical protein
MNPGDRDVVKSLVVRVLEHWRVRDARPGPPCLEERIQAFERRENVELPQDVRTYLLTANGMDLAFRLGKDKQGFAFWPLEAIVRADVQAGREAPPRIPRANIAEFYVFADYLDRSWEYAFKARGEDAGSVVLVDGVHDGYRVASSFGDFLQAYLSEQIRLFPPPARDWQ